MTYKHKSNGTTCSVIDASDGYITYQCVKNGIIYTYKTWVDDFLEDWRLIEVKV